jgi:hypothetical protein
VLGACVWRGGGGHLDEGQALRRRGGAGAAAVGDGEQVGDRGGVAAAGADLDQGADHDAHHVLQEGLAAHGDRDRSGPSSRGQAGGVGGQLVAGGAAVARHGDDAAHGRPRLTADRAEAGEVVLADEVPAAACMAATSRRRG